MSDESYLPSPQDIEQATALIRQGWSIDEHIARRDKSPKLLDCDFKAIEAGAKAERQRLLAIRRNAV